MGLRVLVQSMNRKGYALEYKSSITATNWRAVDELADADWGAILGCGAFPLLAADWLGNATAP